MDHWDLIIVGGGPAGLSAGISGAYHHLQTLILEEKTPGGKAAEIPLIEDYPGFPVGIKGKDFVDNLLKQCSKYGAEIHELERVVELSFEGDKKTVKTSKSEYTADAVIIASGSHPKRLQVPGENELRGRGVSYCAVCDGIFFKGKRVLVVGDGSPAACVAIHLSNLASDVKLVHQGQSLRVEKALLDDLKKRKVELLPNTKLQKIEGDVRVRNVVLFNVESKKSIEMKVDGVFFQLEGVPQSQLAEVAGVEVDESGYIVVDAGQKTNIERVYAAGDVTTNPIKKITMAIGEANLAIEKLIYEPI